MTSSNKVWKEDPCTGLMKKGLEMTRRAEVRCSLRGEEVFKIPCWCRLCFKSYDLERVRDTQNETMSRNLTHDNVICRRVGKKDVQESPPRCSLTSRPFEKLKKENPCTVSLNDGVEAPR